LLGERLDLLQWIGVLMVLVSVIFVSQRRRFWEPLPITDTSS
jgi:drug/metabolite transporter (DMT)-like permease